MTVGPRPTLLERLGERHLLQTLLVYLGVAWGLAQVVEFAVDNYDLSRRILDVTLLLLVLGLPAVGVLTWFHGEQGRQRVRRGEATILGGLVVVAAAGAWFLGTRDLGEQDARNLSAVVDLGDRSVAVMPFGNNLADAELAWLSSGGAELLTTGLAEVPSIRVVSGQRLFDLLRQEGRSDATTIPPDLATRLTRRAGARFMVNGALYGTRDDLQLRADLVDVSDGTVAASSRARGADVFALIDSVTADLAGQIRGGVVSRTELPSVAAVTSRNLEAYKHFLAAVRAERRFRMAEALTEYQRAVELDSTFALAHIRLSRRALDEGQISLALESLDAARRHRDLAPERDRLFMDAIFSTFVTRNSEEGRRLLEEIIARYPDDKEARAALWRMYDGTSEERGRLLREAIALDPFDGVAFNELAYYEARQGNFAAADSLIARYVGLEPGEPNPLDSRGEILMMAGEHDGAREAFREALALDDGFVPSLRHLAESYAAQGEFEEGAVVLRSHLEAADDAAAVPTYQALAMLLTTAGSLDEALGALDSAVAVARRLGEPAGQALALSVSLPILVALQDWNDLDRRIQELRDVDPASPFPGVVGVIALLEQGRQEEAGRLARQVTGEAESSTALRDLVELVSTAIDRELAFYRGELATSVEMSERLRELGGWPELGSYAELRSLIGLGHGYDAVRRAEWIGSFTGAADVLTDVQAGYYRARGYEAAGDTAKALEAYRGLVYGPWSKTLDRIPLLADSRPRLERLSNR